MKKCICAAMAVIGLSMAFGGTAHATPDNGLTGCGIGFAVAPVTQQVGGIGRYAKEAGVNVGEVLRAASATVKTLC